MHAPSCTRSLLSRGFVYDGGDKFGASLNGGDAGDGENEKREMIRSEQHARYRERWLEGREKEREGEKKDGDSGWKLHIVFQCLFYIFLWCWYIYIFM